jgi:hypothetical protein
VIFIPSHIPLRGWECGFCNRSFAQKGKEVLMHTNISCNMYLEKQFDIRSILISYYARKQRMLIPNRTWRFKVVFVQNRTYLKSRLATLLQIVSSLSSSLSFRLGSRVDKSASKFVYKLKRFLGTKLGRLSVSMSYFGIKSIIFVLFIVISLKHI